ncbi:MAG: TldD/PmbA family protein [Candidatus Syntropharchaeia archaeon]
MVDPDFYDIREIEGREFSIVIDNKKTEEISSRFFAGAGIRALVGGSWGFITKNLGDTYSQSLRSLVESAAKLAENIQRRSEKGRIKLEPEMGERKSFSLKAKKELETEEKVEFLREVEKRARISGIASTSVIYFESLLSMKYENSFGENCSYKVSRIGIGIHAVAKKNGVYQMAFQKRYGVGGFEIFDEWDPFSHAEKAGKIALSLLDAKKSPGGRFPVILDQELAGVFIHEALGHAVEADLVLEGDSILEGRIGDKIASELITVRDDPSLKEFGFFPFDDEGVPGRRKTLIEEGILKSYLHSRETAHKLEGKAGNARAQGYSKPIVRMSNTYIENGDFSFEELLEDMGDGIYLCGSRGGQVDTGEGIFQFNAERGYIIEGGEIKTPIRDVSLSGNTLEILKNVKAVANDLRFNPGKCGKNGQLVPVSDGSPHIFVSEAIVGGQNS